jgi:putative ABC transport system permease protein
MIDDLALALRSLRGRVAPAFVAILCLSLGIGVNIALFAVIDALLFRPPAVVTRAESLVRVAQGAPDPNSLSRGAGGCTTFPAYQRILDERATLLVGLAAYARSEGSRESAAGVAPVSMLIATGNYFSVLGVSPHVGRFFDRREGTAGAAEPVAVLSHSYWQRTFAGETSALGQTIRVNGVPLEVVGVAPKGFVGVDLGEPHLWIPMGLAALPEFGGASHYTSRACWLQMVGRLRSGLSQRQAVVIAKENYDGAAAQNSPAPIGISLSSLTTRFYENQQGRNPVPLWSLGISAAVLLLACATVANLLLALAVRRRGDVAIHLALGASPLRIVRQQLMESLILAVAALGGAAVLASVSISFIRRLPIPPIGHVLDVRSVIFGSGVALLAPLLFGVAPALWAATQRELDASIKDADGGRVAAVSRLQFGFMVAQTAIGFVLLLVAGLFLRSLDNVGRIDLGFDADRVINAYQRPGAGSVRKPRRDADLVTVSMERVRLLPGVESASFGGVIPFYKFTRGGFEIADGRSDDEQPVSAVFNVVGPDYFRTLGIRIVDGRTFTEHDREGSTRVAVISRRLAREYWRGASPVGGCLRVYGGRVDECVEVVGVTADIKYESLTGEPSSVLFLPAAQLPEAIAGLTLFVRTYDPPNRHITAVRNELQSLDLSEPFVRVEPLDDRVRPYRIQWEVAASLFSALGVLAALLAGVGLYMVVSFFASQRSKELAIRSALGAGWAHLLLRMLRHGLAVSVTGTVVGGVVGFAVARVFRSQLFGVSPLNLPTYVAVAAALVLIAMLASLRPALLAARVDPANVLRRD